MMSTEQMTSPSLKFPPVKLTYRELDANGKVVTRLQEVEFVADKVKPKYDAKKLMMASVSGDDSYKPEPLTDSWWIVAGAAGIKNEHRPVRAVMEFKQGWKFVFFDRHHHGRYCKWMKPGDNYDEQPCD